MLYLRERFGRVLYVLIDACRTFHQQAVACFKATVLVNKLDINLLSKRVIHRLAVDGLLQQALILTDLLHKALTLTDLLQLDETDYVLAAC